MTNKENVLKYCCLLLLFAPIFASDEATLDSSPNPSRHARAIAEASNFVQEAEAPVAIGDQTTKRQVSFLQSKNSVEFLEDSAHPLDSSESTSAPLSAPKFEAIVTYAFGKEEIQTIPLEVEVLVPITVGKEKRHLRARIGNKKKTVSYDIHFIDDDGRIVTPKLLVDGLRITCLLEEVPMEKSRYKDADGNKVVVGQCLWIEEGKIYRPRFEEKDGKTTYVKEELKIEDGKLILPTNLEGEDYPLVMENIEEWISNPEKTPDPKFPVAAEHIWAVEFTRDPEHQGQIRYSITKIPHYSEFDPVETLGAYLYLRNLGFDRAQIDRAKVDADYTKRLHMDSILYSTLFAEHRHRDKALFLCHRKDKNETIKIYNKFIEKEKKSAKEYGPNFLYTEENNPHCNPDTLIKFDSIKNIYQRAPYRFFADLLQRRRTLYIIDPTQLNRDFYCFYGTYNGCTVDIKIKQCVECTDEERMKNIDELIEMFNNWAIECEQEDKKIVPLMYYVKMIKDTEGKSVPEYWAYNIYTNKAIPLSGDAKDWEGVLDETIEKKEEAMRKIEDSAGENPKYMIFLHRYRDSRSESPVKSRKSQSPSKSPSKSRSPEMSESRGSNELASKAEGLNELGTNGSGTQALGSSKSARRFPTLRPQSRREKTFFTRAAST